jgi:hypothetical protein
MLFQEMKQSLAQIDYLGKFSSNFTQMFTSTRLCAEPMLPLCQLKVKVTLEGQN